MAGGLAAVGEGAQLGFFLAANRLHERTARGEAAAARNVDGVGQIAHDRRARALLEGAGVRSGDRVGLCLPKSFDSVASLLAILQQGAAYVPVDAGAPAERNAFIFEDCEVAAVVR